MRFLGLLTIIFIWSTATGQSACFNNCVTPPSCAEMGYRLESEIFCPNGAIRCPFDKRYKWCKEYKCEDGRYYNSAEEVGGEKGYKCDQVNYHGRDCFDCYCSPNPSECKWTEKNKGEGKISEICCDGTYASCESTCTDTVKVPEHAHGLKEACIGCGEEKEIITKWECDDWYDPKGEGCYARPCDEGYSTAWKAAEDCGQTGSDGWRWETNEHYSGADLCGICIEKQCLAGFGTDKTDAASCGTEKGWKWEKSAQYAGDEICARCTCSAPSTCVWHSGEEGTGTLSDPCCDGSYTTCRSTCEEDAAPNNATCDSRCTGCQKEVCTKWHCNSGWYEENKECHENACEGYAASAEGCGSGSCKANGWSVNTTTCQRGGTTTYQCVKKDCPTGSDTSYSDAKNCGKQGANGWTSTPSSSCNGDDKCYTCTAKQCAEGYGTDKKDVTSCGASGADGWDWDQSGFSGDAPCGKCTPKQCPVDYSPDKKNVNSCGTSGATGWDWNQNGFSGDAPCGKCTAKQCPVDYSSDKKDVTSCGTSGADGWDWSQNGFSGDAPCGKCTPKQCPVEYKAEKKEAKDCGEGSGWQVLTNGKSGETDCTKCECKISCPWSESNKGQGNLSDLCCDGNYAQCTSTCKKVETPENAECTSDGMCSGCGEDPVCTKWKCKEGYHENEDGTGCEEDCLKFATSPCAVGSIYFSDGTCASPEVCLPSDRIPVGVVYWVKDSSGQYGKIINLHDLGRSSSSATFNPEDPYNTTYAKFDWGNYGTDIADLENWDCSSNDYRTVAQTEDRTNPFWSAGMDNTQIIAEVQDNNLQYPASVALAFYPPKVSANDPKLGKGHWYLPTLGEWMDLYGYNYSNLGTSCKSLTGAKDNTISTVNATLTALKSKNVNAETLTGYNYYWSSSEYDRYYAWQFGINSGYRTYSSKNTSYPVRVSLEFGCLTFETSPCAVGSVYFANGTCATAETYTKACTAPSSQPVGVVYWVDYNEHFKVINLKDLGKPADNQPFDPVDPYNTTFPSLYWGYYDYDVFALTNYGYNNTLTALRNKVFDLFDGTGNTEKILADEGVDCSKGEGTADYYKYCVPEAAKAARAFYPDATLKTDSRLGQGNWYLPALGELMDLYGYDYDASALFLTKNYVGTAGANGKNKGIINAALRALKNKGVAEMLTTDDYYLASSEYSGSSSWTFNMKDGYRDFNRKSSNYHVRAGLEIGCPQKTVSKFPEHSIPSSKCITLNGETKYKSFECIEGYSKNKEETACLRYCEIGDVFYANNTCGKVGRYQNGSSPEPVGVVYWVTEDGLHGKAINLQDLKADKNGNFNPDNPYEGEKKLAWGPNEDIPNLENWDCPSDPNDYVPIAKTGDHNHPFWSAGMDNTKIIADSQNNNLQYMAPAALAFYPSEALKADPNFGAGHWYLPTFGELMDLYGYDYQNIDSSTCIGSSGKNGSTKEKVNNTLTTLKSKGVKAEKLMDGEYWSSAERCYTTDDGSQFNCVAWQVSMWNGYRNSFFKESPVDYVRVSLEF